MESRKCWPKARSFDTAIISSNKYLIQVFSIPYIVINLAIIIIIFWKILPHSMNILVIYLKWHTHKSTLESLIKLTHLIIFFFSHIISINGNLIQFDALECNESIENN